MQLKMIDRVPKMTRVIHNGEDWIITGNESVYKLIPMNCVQNNGRVLEVPIGTVFGAGVGSPEYFGYLTNLNQFNTIPQSGDRKEGE